MYVDSGHGMGLERKPEWRDRLDEKTSGKDLQDDDDDDDDNNDVNPVWYRLTWANRED